MVEFMSLLRTMEASLRERGFDMLITWMPIVSLIFIFWPVILTLILAFASASGWLFWLVTSVVFGIIQLFYVIYQFLMVCLDIVGLIILKTFAMLRSQLMYYGVWSGLMKKSGRSAKRSQKRYWKTRLYATNSLAEYKEIPIEQAEEKIHPSVSTSSNQSKPVTKSKSCNNLSSKSTMDSKSTKLEQVPPNVHVTRNNNLGHSRSSINLKQPHSRISDYLNRFPSEKENLNDFDDPDGEAEYQALVERQLGVTGGMLITTTKRLQEARHQTEKQSDSSSLEFLLSGVVKRNHLNVDNLLLEDARSVDSIGQSNLPKEAKEVINGYMDEVDLCLKCIAHAPTRPQCLKQHGNSKSSSDSIKSQMVLTNFQSKNKSIEETNHHHEVCHLNERIQFLHKLKQNTGCTALMLSGGGAQAMYHLGTIKALIESKLYTKFTVLSGTSGGSITAAMCAIKTPEELIEHVCVPTVSTDYKRTGQMKKENIHWFPPLMEMGAYWMNKKLLVDSKDFKKCCDFYYGDITFEEAFHRTGKHVCITVSASRASSGGGGAQRLLLNHISTPHVTLSSAVGASCALPGVMAPAKLMTKDSDGNLEPFEVDGVEWIDGSVQADLPFRRISTLFNVSEYIVCQCNFHVVPFLNKAHHPNKRSLYWRIFQNCEWDIRNRALNLSRLGLFPKIFGQDISKVFKQKYHGNLTLVPRFTKMQLFGLKALSNPTVEDMKIYLKYGQIAAFPYISVMQHMLRLESTIDECIDCIETRRDSIISDDASNEGSGISSMSLGMFRRPRFYSAARDAEELGQKNEKLEKENLALRRKIEMLEQSLNANLQHRDEKISNHILDEKKGCLWNKTPGSRDEHDWRGIRHRAVKTHVDTSFAEVSAFFAL